MGQSLYSGLLYNSTFAEMAYLFREQDDLCKFTSESASHARTRRGEGGGGGSLSPKISYLQGTQA